MAESEARFIVVPIPSNLFLASLKCHQHPWRDLDAIAPVYLILHSRSRVSKHGRIFDFSFVKQNSVIEFPDAMLVAEQPNPSPETFVSVYMGRGSIFPPFEKPGSKSTSLTPARNAFKPPALQHHQPP
jgi:hypothetical protein